MLLPKTIAIHSNAPFAAAQLEGYLHRITGTRPNGPGDGFPIHIRAGESLQNDAYRICIAKDVIRIEGESLRGAAYGVYDFLENDLGCAFWAEDAEYIPQKSSLAVRKGVRTATPAFEYRDVYWRGALEGHFAMKCRLNSARADIPAAWGGRTAFYNYSHTFEDLVPPEAYFDAHPEYFSLVDGRRLREKSQLCLTNPDVLRICIEGVRKWMRENPDCTIFSVAQNDWYSPCTCADCRALDEEEGSHAGTMLHFVNQVADAVRNEYPRNKIHTFAYLYTRKAPRTIRPRDNVIVRLCSIECCFSHPMEGCDFAVDNIDVEDTSARVFTRTDKLFIRDLEAWSQCCDHLYIWDYTTNFANYLQPFPNIQVLQPNLRLLRDKGVKGVFEQGNYAPGKCAAFGALQVYLLSRLLWDPDADVPGLTEAFVRGYYGDEAAPALLAYLALLAEAAQGGHMCIFDGADAAYLDDATLEEGARLMAQALHSTTDARRLERIEREQLSVRYMRLVRLPMDTPGRSDEIDAFAADAQRLGVRELFERRSLPESFDCMKKSLYAADRSQVPYAVYRL